MLGSLTDSLMDSVASVVNLIAVRVSLKPADREHQFGHGKAESVAAIAQAAFILGSAVLLLLHCGENLWQETPHQIHNGGIGFAIMVFAMVLTVALLLVQDYAIRLTDSEALRADRLHYRADLLLNLAVFIALVAALHGLDQIDLYFGVAIALYIAVGAGNIARHALKSLMDHQLPEAVVEDIRSVALAEAGVEGVHDLRTRRSGRDYIIQLHLEINDDRRLIEAHEIADAVESRILDLYPNADVIIHEDPTSLSGHEHPSLPEEAVPRSEAED